MTHKLRGTEVISAVELCSGHICCRCRTTVAGHPNLYGAADAILGDELLKIA